MLGSLPSSSCHNSVRHAKAAQLSEHVAPQQCTLAKRLMHNHLPSVQLPLQPAESIMRQPLNCPGTPPPPLSLARQDNGSLLISCLPSLSIMHRAMAYRKQVHIGQRPLRMLWQVSSDSTCRHQASRPVLSCFQSFRLLLMLHGSLNTYLVEKSFCRPQEGL